MTETTAGSIRKSIHETYEDMTGLEDAAVRVHLGHDVDLLMDIFEDNAMTNRQWIELMEAFSFLEIRRRPNTPDELAAQLVREMTRHQLGELLSEYIAATFSVDEGGEPAIDPESAEGKDSPASETSESPASKRPSRSAPRTAAPAE